MSLLYVVKVLIYLLSIVHWLLKGEVQSKINILLKERVKISLQIGAKIMKIGWEIRKLWHIEISNFFGKHYLTSPYEYSNERVGDVIASQFVIYVIHEILKILIFFHIGVKAYPSIKIYQNKHYFSLILGGYLARFTFS